MASEKPAVGQRYEFCGNIYRVTKVDPGVDFDWVTITWERLDGSEVPQSGRTKLDSDYKFIGWAGGYEPEQRSSGSKAADWLRNVAKVLEEKSISYGDSVGKPIRVFSKAGVTEGIKVRIDDKLSRVARGKEWPGDDVIVDLVGYLALLAVTEER